MVRFLEKFGVPVCVVLDDWQGSTQMGKRFHLVFEVILCFSASFSGVLFLPSLVFLFFFDCSIFLDFVTMTAWKNFLDFSDNIFVTGNTLGIFD